MQARDCGSCSKVPEEEQNLYPAEGGGTISLRIFGRPLGIELFKSLRIYASSFRRNKENRRRKRRLVP
jgi:hypothetical protein